MSQIEQSEIEIDIERNNSSIINEAKAQKEVLEQAELDKHWKKINELG